MEPVVVRKSLLRQVLLMAAGALLVLASVDIMFGHWVSSPPEVDAETGEINTTGRSQHRSDLLWGTLLVVAGGALLVGGAAGALWRAPAVVIGADDLQLRIGGPRRTVSIPWGEVAWVHSGSDGDDERVPPRVFLVHVTDPARYPAQPWGADWDGATLMVDAGSWTMRPADAVIHANVALAHWRRRSSRSVDAEEDAELEAAPPGAGPAGTT